MKENSVENWEKKLMELETETKVLEIVFLAQQQTAWEIIEIIRDLHKGYGTGWASLESDLLTHIKTKYNL